MEQHVLVTGATSEVGAGLIRRLVADGVSVAGMYRSPTQRSQVTALGAEPRLANYDNPDELRAAMQGCGVVFLVTPPLPGQFAREQKAIDIAVETGVERVVRVSASDANRTTSVPWAREHARADQYLAQSGLRWTSLRASGFMQNLLGSAPLVRRGLLLQASGRGELPLIDCDDIAAVAHAVITSDGHEAATYFLTGPESLSMGQVAEKLSHHLGRRIRYISLPGWAFILLIRSSGKTWWQANGLRHQFAGVVRPGHDIDATHDVQRLSGRPATSLDDFLGANLAAFR